MTNPEHFTATGRRIAAALRPTETDMPRIVKNTEYGKHADHIRDHGKEFDFQQAAIEAIARSYEHDDRDYVLAWTAEAQVWATLHLARVTA